MKLVKFKDSTYGIRKGNWLNGYEFLSEKGDWWVANTNVLTYCHLNYETAKSLFLGVTDKGKPVKI